VRFKHEHVTSLADVAVDYDIVVNATGLASATLADDALVRPNRGVLIGVRARACLTLYHMFRSTHHGSDTFAIPTIPLVSYPGIYSL
jgi:glycerol-3-phosphate dehydrogenase